MQSRHFERIFFALPSLTIMRVIQFCFHSITEFPCYLEKSSLFVHSTICRFYGMCHGHCNSNRLLACSGIQCYFIFAMCSYRSTSHICSVILVVYISQLPSICDSSLLLHGRFTKLKDRK